MNVYQKIAEVMKDIDYLQKDDRVETGGGKGYKAISEEKVTSTVRKSLIKNGLVIVPVEQNRYRHDEKVLDKYGNEKVNRLTEVDTKYRIQNIDDAEDYILASSSGSGVDTQDKGVGKAMTYAYKYLLLRTFAIPSGEDPDKVSSDMYSEQFETPKTITKAQAKNLSDLVISKGLSNEWLLEKCGVSRLGEITDLQYAKIVKDMENA